jgi:NAD(P)-dependent dehydrogenase (short-subunit alcohol dehydrogenase family)
MAGKRVVITGATRGLGRAMAMKFAALGHQSSAGRSALHVEELRRSLPTPHASPSTSSRTDR